MNKKRYVCKDHSAYRAIHKPKVRCAGCWKVYMKLNPNEQLTEKDTGEFAKSIMIMMFS